MYEKVNPGHPDKIADRIAGAVVDYAYEVFDNPKIAVEILLGHGRGLCIVECSEAIAKKALRDICECKIEEFGEDPVSWTIERVLQDSRLLENQKDVTRCGDNGIFRGCPITNEQQSLTDLVGFLGERYKNDGKFLVVCDDRGSEKLTVCQSEMDFLPYGIPERKYEINFNPLGPWSGGLSVDSGAVNRKLGSDMGDAVTGGGLHGKDISKADVTLNIICHILAQKLYVPVYSSCSIGDTKVRFWTDDNLFHERELLDEYSSKSFNLLSKFAFEYIQKLGGFEKFAEWGLIRPRVKRGCYEKNSLGEMRREPPSKFLCRNNDIAGVEKESMGVRYI